MNTPPRVLMALLAALLAASACSGNEPLVAEEPCATLAATSLDEFQAVLDQADAEPGLRLRDTVIDPLTDGPALFDTYLTALTLDPNPSVTVVAFLLVDVDGPEADRIRSDLEADPNVESVRVFTASDALEEARLLFADDPEVLQAIESDPSVLPPSFRVEVPLDYAAELNARLAITPGVSQVTDNGFELARSAQAASRYGETLAGTGLAAVVAELSRLECDHEEFLASVGASADQLVGRGAYGDELIADLNSRAAGV